MGQALEYDIANVVDPNFTVVAKVRKSEVEVGPDTAVLTRTGCSHGLQVAGTEDLVIILNYLH